MQAIKVKLTRTAYRQYVLKMTLLADDGEVSSQEVSLTDVDLVQLALDVSDVVQADQREVARG